MQCLCFRAGEKVCMKWHSHVKWVNHYLQLSCVDCFINFSTIFEIFTFYLHLFPPRGRYLTFERKQEIKPWYNWYVQKNWLADQRLLPLYWLLNFGKYRRFTLILKKFQTKYKVQFIWQVSTIHHVHSFLLPLHEFTTVMRFLINYLI